MSTTELVIDVWSDVVCPWCFIGRRRLQKAIAELSSNIHVTVKHRAFQLQPDIQKTERTDTYLAHKYRISAEQVSEMQSNVCSIADGEGLCYDLSDTLSGNTFNAHRLLKWASTQGKEDQLLEAMYSSYFEQKKSLFSIEDLVAVSTAVGLDESAVRTFLDSDQFTTEVRQDIQLASQLGANGVPFYVVNMQYGISGAQPLEVFEQTLSAALNN